MRLYSWGTIAPLITHLYEMEIADDLDGDAGGLD